MQSRGIIEISIKDIVNTSGNDKERLKESLVSYVYDVIDEQQETLMMEMCRFLQEEVRSDLDGLDKKIERLMVHEGALTTIIKAFERRVLEALGKPKPKGVE